MAIRNCEACDSIDRTSRPDHQMQAGIKPGPQQLFFSGEPAVTDRQIVERTMAQQLSRHVHEPAVVENIPTLAQATEYVTESSRLTHELCRALLKLRKGEGEIHLHSAIMGFEDLVEELRGFLE